MRGEAKPDRIFLILISILVAFGLAALFSASTPVGYARFGDPYFFIKRQVLFGLIPGVLFAYVLNRTDFKFFKKFSFLFYVFSLMMLVLVFVPKIGLTINSSRSWLSVGGFSFQPAELAKLGLIFFLAYLLSQKKYDWSNWQLSLLPVLVLISPALLLVLLQPDVGTLSIMVVIIFAMLYVAKVPKKYLAFLSLMGVISFMGLIMAAPYRAERITTFLHPELDPQGVGYQMNQAFLAIGTGGMWGLGFNNSRQKYLHLPEVSADTIFAVIAEENGFLVSAGLIIFIVIFTWRGFKIAKSVPDEFGALLVTGIMVWFGWQSLLNIGATVGALPLTGVPLPFISHGGSSLAVSLAAVGVVLSVSREAKI